MVSPQLPELPDKPELPELPGLPRFENTADRITERIAGNGVIGKILTKFLVIPATIGDAVVDTVEDIGNEIKRL